MASDPTRFNKSRGIMSTPQLTPEQFQAVYPQVAKWVGQTLASHAPEALTVGRNSGNNKYGK